jgi:hypothetical protein
VLSRVLSGPRPKLAKTPANLPQELLDRPDIVAALDIEIERAMAPDPGDRHASVKEFWDQIDPLLRAAAGQAPTTGRGSLSPSAEPSVAMPSNFRVTPSGARPSEAAPPTAASPARSRAEPSGTRAALSAAVPPFHSVPTALLPERARMMSLAPESRGGCALARQLLYRFDGSVWTACLPQPAMDLSRMHGALAMPLGEVLLYGESGALIGVGLDGSAKPWAPPEHDVTWVSATLTPHEIVLLGEIVGQRAYVLASMRPGQAMVRQRVECPSRLHALTRLVTGALLACGDGGELLHVNGPQTMSIPWGRTGHLLAIAAAPDGGAYAVGSGGHAVWITANREAKLEPVQTTRDLFCVAVSPSGVAWAGGGDARLVRRGTAGWARVSLPTSAHGSVRALHAAGNGVLAALDDGVVVDGGTA